MTDEDALKIASWLVADELCEENTEFCNKSCTECCLAVQERLRQMAQKVTVEERPHRVWIQDETCSECGVYSSLNKDTTCFCPNCGRRLEDLT